MDAYEPRILAEPALSLHSSPLRFQKPSDSLLLKTYLLADLLTSSTMRATLPRVLLPSTLR